MEKKIGSSSVITIKQVSIGCDYHSNNLIADSNLILKKKSMIHKPLFRLSNPGPNFFSEKMDDGCSRMPFPSLNTQNFALKVKNYFSRFGFEKKEHYAKQLKLVNCSPPRFNILKQYFYRICSMICQGYTLCRGKNEK